MHRNGAIQFIKTNATLIALVVLTVALALIDPTFPTARNLSNVARQVTIVGIIGVGMTMVILIAGIDLSVGSVVGVAAVVVTLLMQYGLAAWLAVPVTLAIVGGFIGAKFAPRMSPRLLRGAVVVFGAIVAVHLMVKK